MTYTPGTSHQIQTNPTTPAALQATLALLARRGAGNRTDLDDTTDRVDDMEGAFLQTAIADSALTTGEVLRKASPGHVEKADASSIATADVCGVALANTNSGGVATYAPFGVVENPGWALTEGADYWLSAVTAGALVAAPDTETEGAVAVVIGKAQTATALFVNVGEPMIY